MICVGLLNHYSNTLLTFQILLRLLSQLSRTRVLIALVEVVFRDVVVHRLLLQKRMAVQLTELVQATIMQVAVAPTAMELVTVEAIL